jgi:hypothetical protein
MQEHRRSNRASQSRCFTRRRAGACVTRPESAPAIPSPQDIPSSARPLIRTFRTFRNCARTEQLPFHPRVVWASGRSVRQVMFVGFYEGSSGEGSKTPRPASRPRESGPVQTKTDFAAQRTSGKPRSSSDRRPPVGAAHFSVRRQLIFEASKQLGSPAPCWRSSFLCSKTAHLRSLQTARIADPLLAQLNKKSVPVHRSSSDRPHTKFHPAVASRPPAKSWFRPRQTTPTTPVTPTCVALSAGTFDAQLTNRRK